MEEVNISKKQFHDLLFQIRLEMACTRDPQKIEELQTKLQEAKRMRAQTLLRENEINEKGFNK